MKQPALTLPAAASWLVLALLAAPAGPALAADPAPAARPDAAPQVTIYNQNFALVKERSSFTLKEGVNEVRVTDVTAQLEPDSVILRDLKDPKSIRILEQNYEGDPLSQGFLLSQNEGKTLRFEVLNPATGKAEVRSAKLIRSGYVPHQNAWYTFGNEFAMRQQALIGSGGTSPIVEMDGTIRFSLPGQPLFDALGADAILKPTVLWTLGVDQAGTHDVEFSYMTGGLRWEATYNVVAPEKGDRFDLVGW
ncbi:MAG TPA: DUF4140 domain-containing protein, partial [Candidatus Polarisedimenticolia bacterium]|nr:DUF4140 domain-containing protein [Candidatus Polarisedimenticolia bacterium]